MKRMIHGRRSRPLIAGLVRLGSSSRARLDEDRQRIEVVVPAGKPSMPAPSPRRWAPSTGSRRRGSRPHLGSPAGARDADGSPAESENGIETRRWFYAGHLVVLLVALTAVRPAEAQERVPLFDNLGSHGYEITTRGPFVQEYFDQGMRLYYAFNHQEAIRSFREAQRLDPSCAMCWWGEALAWGPNINLAMDSASGVAAYEAIRQAIARRDDVSRRERMMIDALAVRYAADPPADRAHLDAAYADAMREIVRLSPDDSEAAVLFAESLMDLSPWDYWTESGAPRPTVGEALENLERVIARNPNHPGACHFFIHAVEEIHPERAVSCAERLARLMPGAGHLVHMPGHIYVRVGRYLDAVEANHHAIHADRSYIRDQRPGAGMYTAGYFPHNHDFLAFASMMLGRGDEAIEAAEKVVAVVPAEVFGAPGMDFLQHWYTRPLQVRVRFARWDEVLATLAPPTGQPHARGMWHYARGRALAAMGDLAGASAERRALEEILANPSLVDVRLEFNTSLDILGIADKVLAGWIAAAEGRHEVAVAELTEAVRREDALLYGEPPEWTVPVRQDLGAVLLLAERSEEAERAFREDLVKFPANGWSLRGLRDALREQGRDAEARVADEAFRQAWASADAAAVSPIAR